MTHPYSQRPATSFWRRSVSGRPPHDIDPITSVPFTVAKSDRIATAGSCFAQHIARSLLAQGYCYHITEQQPLTAGATDEGYGTYTARFGNIYTLAQFKQIFQRAFGLFEPVDTHWRSRDGHYIDPFRPRIQAAGFASVDELVADRAAHLGAVRRMFETSEVLIFTLGLTEAWRSRIDGSVFPLAPGVVAAEVSEENYEFVNYDVLSIVADFKSLIGMVREINPGLRVIITVSPVALVATYEDRHVLVSTIASKAILRAACDVLVRDVDQISYFPSYEVITGPQARSVFFEEDLRGVTPEGVAHVMSLFRKHYMSASDLAAKALPARLAGVPMFDERREAEKIQGIICDEMALEAPA